MSVDILLRQRANQIIWSHQNVINVSMSDIRSQRNHYCVNKWIGDTRHQFHGYFCLDKIGIFSYQIFLFNCQYHLQWFTANRRTHRGQVICNDRLG